VISAAVTVRWVVPRCSRAVAQAPSLIEPKYSAPSPGWAANTLHLLGDIATHPDRFDAESGAAHYGEALALARRHGMRPLVAHCHLGLGKLYRRIGETEHAQENLTAATTMYREMDMRSWLDRGEAEMAKSV
jgi:predicted protein tyrosine phosphatase